jgi:transcriptional regulator with XRE-family HTH domain
MQPNSPATLCVRLGAKLGYLKEELAELIDSPQSSVSSIERGREQVSVSDLTRTAQVLGKPITYFYAPVVEVDTGREAELLTLLRSVPEPWKQRMLGEMERTIYSHARQPDERLCLSPGSDERKEVSNV